VSATLLAPGIIDEDPSHRFSRHGKEMLKERLTFRESQDMTRGVPIKFKGIYDRAMTGRSQAAAIKSLCLECCVYDRDQVKSCTDPGCPLFN
jgi:hypothetical protein